MMQNITWYAYNTIRNWTTKTDNNAKRYWYASDRIHKIIRRCLN